MSENKFRVFKYGVSTFGTQFHSLQTPSPVFEYRCDRACLNEIFWVPIGFGVNMSKPDSFFWLSLGDLQKSNALTVGQQCLAATRVLRAQVARVARVATMESLKLERFWLLFFFVAHV